MKRITKTLHEWLVLRRRRSNSSSQENSFLKSPNGIPWDKSRLGGPEKVRQKSATKRNADGATDNAEVGTCRAQHQMRKGFCSHKNEHQRPEPASSGYNNTLTRVFFQNKSTAPSKQMYKIVNQPLPSMQHFLVLENSKVKPQKLMFRQKSNGSSCSCPTLSYRWKISDWLSA